MVRDLLDRLGAAISKAWTVAPRLAHVLRLKVRRIVAGLRRRLRRLYVHLRGAGDVARAEGLPFPLAAQAGYDP